VVDRPRRRVTPTAVLVAVLASALAFGALSVQISLIHRQQRLDSIRAEITEVQLSNKELRQQESRLQAPAEILRIARDELGMVESKPPELVTPAVETVGATPDTGTATPSDPDAAAPSDG
jgi:cell division protein FtsL